MGTEYYAKPQYAVHQAIVAQGPIEPGETYLLYYYFPWNNVLNDSLLLPQTVLVNNYEPIENNDSTVISAAEYNEYDGYSYKKPEGF